MGIQHPMVGGLTDPYGGGLDGSLVPVYNDLCRGSRVSFFMKASKAEMICVQPKSSKAKNRFANEMDKLHSCVVKHRREDGKIFLASISNRYFFWMSEVNDDHWEIV